MTQHHVSHTFITSNYDIQGNPTRVDAQTQNSNTKGYGEFRIGCFMGELEQL